jgi:hypothetical protein
MERIAMSEEELDYPDRFAARFYVSWRKCDLVRSKYSNVLKA